MGRKEGGRPRLRAGRKYLVHPSSNQLYLYNIQFNRFDLRDLSAPLQFPDLGNMKYNTAQSHSLHLLPPQHTLLDYFHTGGRTRDRD